MTKENEKSRMSTGERERRRATVGKAASEKVAKSEQLNFRIEEQTIKELQELAFAKGLPVGAMIREWVLERLLQEKLGTPQLTGRALRVLDEIHLKLNSLFENVERRP
jgi:predicted DNA binding CopG/RHH family protein